MITAIMLITDNTPYIKWEKGGFGLYLLSSELLFSLNGEVNTIIRIYDKKKWRTGAIFRLKCSHQDKESIKVIIVESTEQVAKYISEEVLVK